MNWMLFDDIYVNNVVIVDDDFYCCYDCVGKCYCYKVY